MANMELIQINSVGKTFILHNQDGTQIPVLSHASFSAHEGECLVLHGPSGAGKSTMLKMIYGNYKSTEGAILVFHHGQWIDICKADPRDILQIRKVTMAYVSQFLRVIPRVTTLDIVSQPLIQRGTDENIAKKAAADMLARLNIPDRLWHLAPATFSGGEQQRVNIARSFIVISPIMLLDEPTASLDVVNRDVVIDLIQEAREAGSALIGIFHDAHVRDRVATRKIDIHSFSSTEAA
jgi:alpha-D-ribose 1-methylphosphonate 5-triphosphate synthase subunit PhnL